ELAVGGGQLDRVVGGGVQIGGDGVGVEARNGFDDSLLVGKGGGASPLGSEAGEQVGCDDDVAHGREVVGHRARPIAQAEDLVNQDDHRRLVAHLGIDDESVNGAVAVSD